VYFAPANLPNYLGVLHEINFASVRNLSTTSPTITTIGRTVAKIWPFFDFSRYRPSAILDLLYACLDHPRRVVGGVCHCAQFGWNPCSSFNNMHVLIFWALGFKMHIPAHFGGVFGVKIGEIRNFLQFYPSIDAIIRDWRSNRVKVGSPV